MKFIEINDVPIYCFNVATKSRICKRLSISMVLFGGEDIEILHELLMVVVIDEYQTNIVLITGGYKGTDYNGSSRK